MVRVYGIFKHSLELELGINTLKENGFTGDKLTVIVLNRSQQTKQKILDSMYKANGMSLLDGMAMLGGVGMLLGVIYGSQVYIGPIALGLIGFFIGGTLGLIIDRAFNKSNRKSNKSSSGEVIIVVHCINEDEADIAEIIMKEHLATALGRRPIS